MAISTLEPTNIILANIYFIMILQIALNFQSANCNTNSNLFQVAFITIMLIRIILQELYLNRYITKKLYKPLMLFSSGFLLTGIAAF